MIKLVKVDDKSSEESFYYHVYVDNSLCERAYASGTKKRALSYNSESPDSSRKLKNQTLQDFKYFDYISLDYYFEWLNFSATIFLSSNSHKEGEESKTIEVEINLYPKLEEWKEKYSFDQYRNIFYSVWQESETEENKLHWGASDSISLWTRYRIPLSNDTISNILANYENKFKKLHEETLGKIEIKSPTNLLTIIFNFPEEIKTSCEQYLLYFAQFLHDLGISASSTIKEEIAGKVLFSVTPVNNADALDKIGEALAVYLNLPSNPIIYDQSFASVRLQQQVDNLQHSQKMIARELQISEHLLLVQSQTIKEKNLIISQKDLVIEQQSNIIDKIESRSIMMDSAESKEEIEEIYNGLKIGESKFLKEQLGIYLNPAKVIKTAVKNTFGKEKDNLSILESNEDKQN